MSSHCLFKICAHFHRMRLIHCSCVMVTMPCADFLCAGLNGVTSAQPRRNNDVVQHGWSSTSSAIACPWFQKAWARPLRRLGCFDVTDVTTTSPLLRYRWCAHYTFHANRFRQWTTDDVSTRPLCVSVAPLALGYDERSTQANVQHVENPPGQFRPGYDGK